MFLFVSSSNDYFQKNYSFFNQYFLWLWQKLRRNYISIFLAVQTGFFFYCLCWYCDTYLKIVGLYLAYSFEINSFKIVDKHLKNFMIDFSLYIFRDHKFSVLFIWSIYLAHLGKGGMWTRKYWGFKILKPYANMYILCMYTLSVKL